MVDLKALHLTMEEELKSVFDRVMKDSKLILGPDVFEFEQNLGNYLGGTNVVTCGNGTDAIMLALMALDLPKGSEIIVPSFNYISGPEVIQSLGYQPIFCDVDEQTYNVTTETIEALLTPHTSAIIVTHMFGQPCQMKPIMDLAAKHNLKVIEDNAQSTGAKTGGRFAGTIGDVGTTSFYPTKVLGCMGDGGAVITNNKTLADKVRLLANHGQQEKFNYEVLGVNSRLDTLQAAILNVKLKYLPEMISKRQEVASQYNQLLAGMNGLRTPEIAQDSEHIYYQYVIQLASYENREELKEFMNAGDIPAEVYYPNPIHTTPVFNSGNQLRVTEDIVKRILSLPMHATLGMEDQELVIKRIRASNPFN